MRVFVYVFAVVSLTIANALAHAESQSAPKPSEPIVLDGKTDLTLSGLRIANAGDNCILLKNCKNIRIEDCDLGPSVGEGIHILNCEGVIVTRCYFEHVRTGVYAQASKRIDVNHCTFKNIQGPFPRGQFVQFNDVTGPENRINDNVGENIQGESYPEDAINLYKAKGTPEDPIQVMRNKIRGGGPSGSGGGIMTGDDGGGYTVVKDNVLVDPGQYGIAIADGDHIQILDNKVYAKRQAFTNVGLYVWKQYGGECSDHVVKGNQVNWTNRAGKKNSAWNAGNCGPVNGWDQNDWDAKIDATILPKDLLTSGKGEASVLRGPDAAPVVKPKTNR